MRTTTRQYVGAMAFGIAVLLAAWPAGVSPQQATDPAIRIGAADLG